MKYILLFENSSHEVTDYIREKFSLVWHYTGNSFLIHTILSDEQALILKFKFPTIELISSNEIQNLL